MSNNLHPLFAAITAAHFPGVAKPAPLAEGRTVYQFDVDINDTRVWCGGDPSDCSTTMLVSVLGYTGEDGPGNAEIAACEYAAERIGDRFTVGSASLIDTSTSADWDCEASE